MPVVVDEDTPRPARQVIVGEEIALAGRSYLAGHDNDTENHLRAALAALEGKRRGLP